MKKYFFLITLLGICSILSCSFRKDKIEKADNEFALYSTMQGIYASEKMKIYHNDTLLFNGDFRISEDISIMYISNVRKGEMSHIRLQAMNIDTTFSISTINVDSILIGIPESGIPIIFDNHTKGVWLVD